ncbi:MAG: hypothetical protein F7C07_02360 [Desulfurococcales archaeon]|nr:hypothetical protein [Desulfurococcales archaeon]
MPRGLDIEVVEASLKLVRDVLGIGRGQEVVITADTLSDWRVVEAVASSVRLVGGKPLVTWYPAPSGVGKAVDRAVPSRSLVSALKSADAWIELNKAWLLYSSIYDEVLSESRLKYMCLVGMDADMMVRMIGRVDVKTLYEFQRALARITGEQRKMRIMSPSGTDLSFENDPERPVIAEGEVAGPGEYMLFGQVSWAPIEDSIDGVVVIDGSLWPPEELGLLRSPVKLYIERGRIVDIEGGVEAGIFKSWLESFRDDRMYYLAHISYGCNPGARLSGNILEDERVWGVVDFGFGSQAEAFKGSLGLAASHTDGICTLPTVAGDKSIILENGAYVHPDLAGLAEKLLASYRGES